MRKTGLRVVLLSVLLTFGLAGVALAHVEVSPNQVPAGAVESFTIEVPTEKEIPTTEVRVELPEGFEAGGAEAPSGWQGEVQGNALVWTGGEIPVANSEEFSFEATAPDEAGSFSLKTIQTYQDGSVAEWTGAPDSEEPAPVIEVAPSGGASGEMDEPQHGDTHGSHEEVPDTGGVNVGLLLGACVAVLAAASLLLRSAVR